MASSTDGNSWNDLPFAVTDLGGDWKKQRLTASSLPAGSICVRLRVLDHSGEIWNPQIGQIDLQLR
jgi:hypothetical protein